MSRVLDNNTITNSVTVPGMFVVRFQTASEREKDSLELGAASQASQIRELKAKVTQLEHSTRNQRSNNTDAEVGSGGLI